MTCKKILFTGSPGCRKSTLIEKIIQKIETLSTGFFTQEVREKGRRVGFSIYTLDRKQSLLAYKRIKSNYMVEKYGVNLADIGTIAVPSVMPERPDALVVIDEIGKMECFSDFQALFKDYVLYPTYHIS